MSTGVDPEDATISLRYADGSLATIVYATAGDTRYPKEALQVFGGGGVAAMHNFRRAEVWRGGRRRTHRSHRGIDKGQQVEVNAFLDAVISGRPMPITLSSLVATTEATLAAVRSLVERCRQPVGPAAVAEPRQNRDARPELPEG